jgi:hypothetical protein
VTVHYDRETLSHSADLISEVAEDPTHEHHGGYPEEIELLRAEAIAVRAGEADPPQWALDIIDPPKPRRYTGRPSDGRCPKGCGPV